MKSWRHSWIAIASAVVLLGSGCHERAAIERSRVTSDDARHVVAVSTVAAPGIVEPWDGEIRLASFEAGVVAALLVVEGQAVTKGQVLARIEDSAQRMALVIADADVRQAVAQLEGTSSTPEELRIASAELRAATVRAEQQQKEKSRAEALGASGVLATAEVDRALAAAQLDEAALLAAEARLHSVKRGARASERRLALARRAGAEARLEEARAALTRREIRAPVDGVVLWSRYHVGEYYAPSQGPLLVLGDLRRLQVRLEVDDGNAGDLLVGARCDLRDDTGRPLGEGKVSRIALEYGTRTLSTERPTARTDARVREVFVEVAGTGSVAPGQRLWGYVGRPPLQGKGPS